MMGLRANGSHFIKHKHYGMMYMVVTVTNINK